VAATPGSYFERLWAASPDPWDHTGRWYETRKYDLTVAALPRARYARAVEPACGVGLLTIRLAGRAAAVVASDRYPRATAETSQRCRSVGHVTVRTADIRDGPPPGLAYDLAVLGEVLYYFDATTVTEVLRSWQAGCTAGGHLVIVHHRPAVPEHVLSGDAVHLIATDLFAPALVHVADPDFLIDVFDVSSSRRAT
jgi:cyclopropane fatty-acyl-phospholipid synthase-like methyltransferase